MTYNQRFFQYDDDTLLWGDVSDEGFDFTYKPLHLDGTTEPFEMEYIVMGRIGDNCFMVKKPAGAKASTGIYVNWYYGFMDTELKTVLLPVEYGPGYKNTPKGNSRHTTFVDGCIVLSKDGKFGALNENLEVILPFEYDKLLWLETYEAPYLLSYEKDGVKGRLVWADGEFTEVAD